MLDVFNASAPFYSHADLMAAADWSVLLHDMLKGRTVTVKRVRKVFEPARVGHHVVDLFAKTVLALAGRPALAGALKQVYDTVSSRYPQDSETYLLLFLLYKKVSRRGRVAFGSLLELHDALLRAHAGK